MSQENVEIVEKFYETMGEAFDRAGEGQTVEEFVSARHREGLADPDIELRQMEALAGTAGVFRGYEGLYKAMLELTEVFSDLRFFPVRHVEADDLVVTRVRIEGKGLESGIVVDTLVGHVWTLRSGRVLRYVVYPTPAEALAAVGLSE